VLGLPRSARRVAGSDPRSPIAKANLVTTCGRCHAGANASFVQYQPHANAHKSQIESALYFVRLFMNLLLAALSVLHDSHHTVADRSRYDQIREKPRRRKECLIRSLQSLKAARSVHG